MDIVDNTVRSRRTVGDLEPGDVFWNDDQQSYVVLTKPDHLNRGSNIASNYRPGLTLSRFEVLWFNEDRDVAVVNAKLTLTNT